MVPLILYFLFIMQRESLNKIVVLDLRANSIFNFLASAIGEFQKQNAAKT